MSIRIPTSQHIKRFQASAANFIKKSESKMLISGIITGILAIGTIIAACYNKDILDFAKDQAKCITAVSVWGANFLFSAAILGYFTYKRSVYIDARDDPYKYIREHPITSMFIINNDEINT